VQENLGAIVTRDKPEAFVVVKELDLACWHFSHFQLNAGKCSPIA
jgi:hypothetical protein